jgi:predicted alpha/beta hydrolase
MIELKIEATDGYPLAAELRRPPAGRPENGRLLLIACATGVKKTFYRPIAEFFAGRGWVVVGWDWRGIGGSRPESWQGFEGGMADWGRKDLPGVESWAKREFPNHRKAALGHSFGGQSIGFSGADSPFEALVAVASQSGWWGHWPAPRKYFYAALWSLWLPAWTHLLGRYPARMLGGGEDLPKNVALDWARWCRNPDYLGRDSRHEEFKAPILAYGFADDSYAPKRAIEALLARYGSPSQELRFLRPEQASLPTVGHWGFFRPSAAQLWEEAAGWLEAKLV